MNAHSHAASASAAGRRSHKQISGPEHGIAATLASAPADNHCSTRQRAPGTARWLTCAKRNSAQARGPRLRRTQVCSRRLDLLELKRAWLADTCRAPPPAPRPAPAPGPEPRGPPDSGAKGELGTPGPPCGPALPSPAGAGSGVARIAAVAACSSDWPSNCAPQPARQRRASAGAIAQPGDFAGLRPAWRISVVHRRRCTPLWAFWAQADVNNNFGCKASWSQKQ